MVRSSAPRLAAFALLAAVAPAILAGCTPSCERTCRKVLKCDGLENDRVSLVECEASCKREGTTYDGWADEKELDRAFDDHRRCLVRSTCEEIEAGECYDERLFHLGGTTPTDTGAASR